MRRRRLDHAAGNLTIDLLGLPPTDEDPAVSITSRSPTGHRRRGRPPASSAETGALGFALFYCWGRRSGEKSGVLLCVRCCWIFCCCYYRERLYFFRVSSLAYPNLFGEKGYVVVVVVDNMSSDVKLVKTNCMRRKTGWIIHGIAGYTNTWQ